MNIDEGALTSEILVEREKTDVIPFVRIKVNGIIEIAGNSVGPDIRKFFLSLLWGINKIVSTKAIVSLDLDRVNVASIRYLFIFFRALSNHHLINDIMVFWFFEEWDEDSFELGKLFEEQLPHISFMFYGK